MQPSKKTLYEYFSDHAELRGDDLFISNESAAFSVKQAFGIAKHLAEQLSVGGVRRGDRVAVKADRTVKTVLVFFALQFLGGVAVMCDPRENTEGRIAVIDGELIFDGKATALDFSEAETAFEPAADSMEPTVIIFTSGSTGHKKAVMLSQYNFINNSLDTKAIGGYRDDDVNMLIVPICHVFGLALIVTAAVIGHGIFVPQNVKPEYLIRCMESYGVTRLNGVPSMYLALAEARGAARLKLNCGLIGGGPCTKEQFFAIEKTLGIRLLPVYGMSECIGISCASYDDAPDIRAASVGKVYSMNTVRIESDGEVSVKSPAMSSGYIDGDVAAPDGWLHTGDLGFIDNDGYLHITGRKKDIIIRNGNNLSALEIERKLLSVEGVKDVCVVGITDNVCGEVPCALIVGNDYCAPAHYRKVLTKIEMPAIIAYTERIPQTSSGKQDKQRVRAMFYVTKEFNIFGNM